MRKKSLVKWLLDPKADHFPRKWVVSFSVLANFDLRTNKHSAATRLLIRVAPIGLHRKLIG
jgi:hypothetical protein